MSQEVMVYVLGGFVAVLAIAMCVQVWAMFSVLIAFRPILPKCLRTLARGKELGRESQRIFLEVKPAAAKTAAAATDVAHLVSDEVLIMRHDIEMIQRPLLRLRYKARHFSWTGSPQRIQEPTGPSQLKNEETLH